MRAIYFKKNMYTELGKRPARNLDENCNGGYTLSFSILIFFFGFFKFSKCMFYFLTVYITYDEYVK